MVEKQSEIEGSFDITPNPATEKMPFGKYKDSTIASLPRDYLAYLMDEIDELEERNAWLAQAIRIQWSK